MPSVEAILTEEQKEYVSKVTRLQENLLNFLRQKETARLIGEINLEDIYLEGIYHVRRLSPDDLEGIIKKAKEISTLEEFYSWRQDMTKFNLDLVRFDTAFYNRISARYDIFFSYTSKDIKNELDGNKNKGLNAILADYQKRITEKKAKNIVLSTTEAALEKDECFKDYAVLSAYRSNVKEYQEGREDTAFFRKEKAMQDYNDRKADILKKVSPRMNILLNDFPNLDDGTSDEWKALKRAMNQAHAAYDAFVNTDSDPVESGRKMVSAMALLTMTAHNYAAHKEQQKKTEKGSHAARYNFALRVISNVNSEMKGLASNAATLNALDYVNRDAYAASNKFYNADNNPILRQIRHLQALSDELAQIEKKSHRTSSEYKQLKKQLDQFISVDKAPVKDLLGEIKDPALYTQVWNRYMLGIENIINQSGKYLDHKKLKNDGSEGSLLRMDAVLRLRDYLIDLKDAEAEYEYSKIIKESQNEENRQADAQAEEQHPADAQMEEVQKENQADVQPEEVHQEEQNQEDVQAQQKALQEENERKEKEEKERREKEEKDRIEREENERKEKEEKERREEEQRLKEENRKKEEEQQRLKEEENRKKEEEQQKQRETAKKNREAYAAHVEECRNDIAEKVQDDFAEAKDSILLDCYEAYVFAVAEHVYKKDVDVDDKNKEFLAAVEAGRGTEFAKKLMEEDKKNPESNTAQVLSADNLIYSTADMLRSIKDDNHFQIWLIYNGEMVNLVQSEKEKQVQIMHASNIKKFENSEKESLKNLANKMHSGKERISKEDFNKAKSDIIDDCCRVYAVYYFHHASKKLLDEDLSDEDRERYGFIADLVQDGRSDELVAELKKSTQNNKSNIYNWLSEEKITPDNVEMLLQDPANICRNMRKKGTPESVQAKLLEKQKKAEEKKQRELELAREEEERRQMEERKEEERRKQEAIKKEKEEKAAKEREERERIEAPVRNARQLKLRSYEAQKELSKLLHLEKKSPLSRQEFNRDYDITTTAAYFCRQIYLSNLYDFAKESQLQGKATNTELKIIEAVEKGEGKEYLDQLLLSDLNKHGSDDKSAFFTWFDSSVIDVDTAQAMTDPAQSKEISKKAYAGLKSPAYYLDSYSDNQRNVRNELVWLFHNQKDQADQVGGQVWLDHIKKRSDNNLQDDLYRLYADSLYKLAKERQGTSRATYEDFIRINLMETGRREELIRQIKANDKTVGEAFDIEKMTYETVYRAYKDPDKFAKEIDDKNDALLHPKMEVPKVEPKKVEPQKAADQIPAPKPEPRVVEYSEQAEEDIAQTILSEQEMAELAQAEENRKQFQDGCDQAVVALAAACEDREKWQEEQEKLPNDLYCRIYAARMYALAKDNDAAGKASPEELRRIRMVEAGMGEKWISELMKVESEGKYFFDKHNFNFDSSQPMANPETIPLTVGNLAGRVEPLIKNVQEFRRKTEKTRRELKASGLAESKVMYDFLKEDYLSEDDLYQVYAGDFYTMAIQTPFEERSAVQKIVVDYVSKGNGPELITALKEGNNTKLWLAKNHVVFDTVRRLADPFESMVLAEEIFNAAKAPVEPEAKPEEKAYKEISDEELEEGLEEEAVEEEPEQEKVQDGSAQITPEIRKKNADALRSCRIVAVNALSAIMDRGMNYMQEHKAALHPDTLYRIYAADLYDNAIEQKNKDEKSLSQDQRDCIELVETGRTREFIVSLKNQTRQEKYALDTNKVKWKTAVAMSQADHTKEMSLEIAQNSKFTEKAVPGKEEKAAPEKVQNENVVRFISDVENSRAFLADLTDNRTPEVFSEDIKDFASYTSDCLYQVYIGNLYQLAKAHQADKTASWKENNLADQIERGEYYVVQKELKADDAAARYQFASDKLSFDTVSAMADAKSNKEFTLRLQADNRSIDAFLTGKASEVTGQGKKSEMQEITAYVKTVLDDLKAVVAGKKEPAMSKSDMAFTIYSAFRYSTHAENARKNPDGASAKLVNSIKNKEDFIKYVEIVKQKDKNAGKMLNNPSDKVLAEMTKSGGILKVVKEIAKAKKADIAKQKNKLNKKGPENKRKEL